MTGTTTYYPAAGAMRVDGAVYYILGDQLSSTSVVTDTSGVKVGTQGYYPFGETRYTTDTLFTDRLYTGQQQIAGLGLYNYKARDYDPALGRFISADSVTPGGPQGLNRYSYTSNNPVNHADPTGHMATECGGQRDACGGSGDPFKIISPTSISNNNVDSGYNITSIGGVPSTQPHRTTSYGEIEDSCGGCSAEGEGSVSGVDELGLINDLLGAGLDAKAIYDQDEITVYVAFLRKLGLQVNSLYINNRTSQPVSVSLVAFEVHEFAPTRICYTGLCLFSAPDQGYNVLPGLGIWAKGVHIGIGSVAYPGGEPIGLTTRIPLIPSGNLYNPINSFHWNTEVTMKIGLMNSNTGTYWPIISYTFPH